MTTEQHLLAAIVADLRDAGWTAYNSLSRLYYFKDGEDAVAITGALPTRDVVLAVWESGELHCESREHVQISRRWRAELQIVCECQYDLADPRCFDRLEARLVEWLGGIT